MPYTQWWHKCTLVYTHDLTSRFTRYINMALAVSMWCLKTCSAQQQVFTHTCPAVIDPLEKLWLYSLLPLCATASARAYGFAPVWERSLRDPARRLIVFATRFALFKLMMTALVSCGWSGSEWNRDANTTDRRGYSRARPAQQEWNWRRKSSRFGDQETTPTDHRLQTTLVFLAQDLNAPLYLWRFLSSINTDQVK